MEPLGNLKYINYQGGGEFARLTVLLRTKRLGQEISLEALVEADRIHRKHVRATAAHLKKVVTENNAEVKSCRIAPLVFCTTPYGDLVAGQFVMIDILHPPAMFSNVFFLEQLPLWESR